MIYITLSKILLFNYKFYNNHVENGTQIDVKQKIIMVLLNYLNIN